MAAVEKIFAEYARLRDGGMEAKTILNILRTEIEVLSDKERQDLGRFLKALEAGEITSPGKTPRQMPPVKSGVPPSDSDTQQMIPVKSPPQVSDTVFSTIEVEITCSNCGKINPKKQVVCYSCGHLLEPPQSAQETRALAETNDLSYSEDFFGQDSVLVLRVRATDHAFTLRPQKSDHELVIGRSASGSPVAPDIDLATDGGEKLGVSRMHLSIRYDDKSHTLSVLDMGSANGSYINGQRLHPHEVRVLRDQDEVRMGKMMMVVSFQHD